MKLDEVPQDAEGSIYAGHRKLLYAVDNSGSYQRANSAGWEAESYATEQALLELEELEQQAYQRWLQGETSVLPWLMYRFRMDEAALAQCTGLWRWRVRRHFCPQRFQSLSERLLQRYADAFSLPLAQLRAYQQGPDDGV